MKHSIIKNKDQCTVLVVEKTASVRQMIVDILKEFGFTSIQGVPSIKDAISYLEVEKVGWIITSLQQHEKYNALHLLKIITENPKLFSINTSLLVEQDSDDFCLPLAFEMGLLSYHQKSYIREEFADQFKTLLQTLKLNDWNATLCSADFARNYLTAKRFYKARLALEHNLLSLFPGTPRVLYYLAEAEFLNNEKERGLATLNQVKIIDEKFTSHCKKLQEKYLGNVKKLETPDKIANVLGIRNVVIVDPDTDIHFHGEQLLNAVGVNDIECFEDGKNAFQWLSSSTEPDLIIMEWRIMGYSGPIFVQKVREHGFVQVPIVVVSSLVKPGDKGLLREMGVDECLKKPFDKSSFYSTIIWALQQHKFPSEEKSFLRKIRRLFATDKLEEAERLMNQLFLDERSSEGAKLEAQAEYQFKMENYKKLETLE